MSVSFSSLAAARMASSPLVTGTHKNDESDASTVPYHSLDGMDLDHETSRKRKHNDKDKDKENKWIKRPKASDCHVSLGSILQAITDKFDDDLYGFLHHLHTHVNVDRTITMKDYAEQYRLPKTTLGRLAKALRLPEGTFYDPDLGKEWIKIVRQFQIYQKNQTGATNHQVRKDTKEVPSCNSIATAADNATTKIAQKSNHHKTMNTTDVPLAAASPSAPRYNLVPVTRPVRRTIGGNRNRRWQQQEQQHAQQQHAQQQHVQQQQYQQQHQQLIPDYISWKVAVFFGVLSFMAFVGPIALAVTLLHRK